MPEDRYYGANVLYRWRRGYGSLSVDQAKRLKEVEKENTRLKRLVAELSLDKAILKEVAEGKSIKPDKETASCFFM